MEHTAIVPLLARMVRWSNEAETLHTLEDAPLEQSGSALGLEPICPLTFWRKRPAVKPGAFITNIGIFLNVSWLWERHVRPSWGYGLSAQSGGVGRPLGRLTEFAFWPNVCVLASYRILFDTNGAYNRGNSRVDRGGNVEIEFGASGRIPIAAEVCVCFLHWLQHKYRCVEAVTSSVIHPHSLESAPVLWR